MLNGGIIIALCSVWTAGTVVGAPHFSDLNTFHNIDSRQFFGGPPQQFNNGFRGPQNGNPFGGFNQNQQRFPPPFQQQQQPQQQQQQQQPPRPPPKDGAALAAVFQLAVDHFPADDDVAQDNNKLPGILSGNINVNPSPVVQPQLTAQAPVPVLPTTSCVPTNRPDATGECANVFDIVINRRCSGSKTAKSQNCQNSESCCFKLAVDDHVGVPFDQVPCGLRRTPELAQRELQRIADEENFETIPLRILGGLEAFQNEICWQAAILVDGKYVCGGAVINSKHVLTAGHCLNDVENLRQLQVVTGIKDLKNLGKCADNFAVSDIIFNENYDPRSLVFDMAILELESPITRTNCTCKICLPDGNIDLETKGNLDCIVTGFGTTEPGKTPSDIGPLNVATVSVVSDTPDNRKCSDRLHHNPSIPQGFFLDESMICAIGEEPKPMADTCDLDGGSALACRMQPDVMDVYTLVGLSSWGLPCGKNIVRDPSGRDVRIPTVYAHVRTAMKWIEQKTRL